MNITQDTAYYTYGVYCIIYLSYLIDKKMKRMKKSRLLVAHLFFGQFHGTYFSIIAFFLPAVERLLLEPAAHQAILQIKMDIVILKY